MKRSSMVIRGHGPNSMTSVWIALILLFSCGFVNVGCAHDVAINAHAAVIKDNGNGQPHWLIITVVVTNKSADDVVLPTKNIGPLVAFNGEGGSVEVVFMCKPKMTQGGGFFIESKCSYFPVLLKQNESAQMVARIEISKKVDLGDITVVYDTTYNLMGRYEMAMVKLSTKAVAD